MLIADHALPIERLLLHTYYLFSSIHIALKSASELSGCYENILIHRYLIPVSNEMAVPFKDALARLENRRVKLIRPLIPPQILQEDLPLCVSFL